jgi:hypothetical protein
MPRWAAKVDSTSHAVIAAFRAYGADWLDTSRSPGIDGWVLFRGRCIPVEIKTPLSKTGTVKLTETQERLKARGWPIVIVTSADDVRHVLGLDPVI